MSWFAIGATVVSAGASIYSTQQQKKSASKALDAQRTIGEGLEYEPVDIEKLKIDAQNQAIANATASLAIERSLQPDVSATRDELARQIRTDLERGGELPVDVQNRVNTAGRVIGGRSGVGAGGTTPLTAALLGLSSLDLSNERQREAQNLLSANPLQPAGLDPGTLASLEVANNAAFNDFNAAKAGVDSNLAQSEAAARASQIAGQTGLISSLASSIGQVGNAYQASNNTTKPKYDTAISRNTSGLGLTQQYKPLGGVQPFATS